MSGFSIRDVKHGWVWIAVAFGVLVTAGGVTPWDAITELIANRGVGDEQATLIGFVAGYTLPLTVGFTIVGLVGASGATEGWHPAAVWIGIAVVLFVCGLVASGLGLGQLPVIDTTAPPAGPWFARPLAMVLQGYVNQYGSGLVLASMCIAAGLTFSIVKWSAEEPSTSPAP